MQRGHSSASTVPVANAALSVPSSNTTPAQATAPRVSLPAYSESTGSIVPALLPASVPETPFADLSTCRSNSAVLGVSRMVEIDTTDGPGFGFEHFKEHDFLHDKEVVLTFDDGPWPHNTPAVLAALAAHCIKATFFPIGKHAIWHPEILRQVAQDGHTIGSHTWSHADLSKKSPEEAKREIEMGASAVHMAVGGKTAPFFRFPALRHPPEMVTYLGQRNVAIFSCDMDSFDFAMRKPDQVIRSVMNKLAKHGKGIILMHDFQRATAEALPELLNQLKANGYKIVHMVPKAPLQTLAQYDEMVQKENKLPTVSLRPTSSVVRSIP
ncbi:MAG TPA: polysaccharide deacetylase family protein [Bradyrhizobium sp.]|nr:polysaccharide deacetylase family protein [Bradyrhizobium sp.]